MSEPSNLFVVDGPLSRHKLAVLRDERTPTPEFRQAMKELATIMVAEATREHPDVNFYAAAVDPELNGEAFIVPGLGDAGDRLYGTL